MGKKKGGRYRFRVLSGSYRDTDKVDYGPGLPAGDVLRHNARLDRAFPDVIEMVKGDEPATVEPDEVEQPEEDVVDTTPPPKNSNDVTDKYPIAKEADFVVTKKPGGWLFVSHADAPEEFLNKKGLRADAVESFVENLLADEDGDE